MMETLTTYCLIDLRLLKLAEQSISHANELDRHSFIHGKFRKIHSLELQGHMAGQ